MNKRERRYLEIGSTSNKVRGRRSVQSAGGQPGYCPFEVCVKQLLLTLAGVMLMGIYGFKQRRPLVLQSNYRMMRFYPF